RVAGARSSACTTSPCSRDPGRPMTAADEPRTRAVSARFLLFVVAGAAGFVVGGGVLTLLMRVWHWNPFAARAVSFPLAVTVTWLINRNVAFAGGVRHDTRTEYAGYFGIQIVGALINLAVFTVCLTVWPALEQWPLVPFAAGAGVALVFNF